MNKVDIHAKSEQLRLAALYSLGIHGGERFVIFDRLVHLAVDFFGVPMATIALIDADRQIFFAKAGIASDGTPRADSICTHTVAENKTLVIHDLAADLRWCSRTFQAEGLPLRFYAGTPIHVGEQPVGTFCLLDHQPRPYFDQDDVHLLQSLALIAEDLLTVIHLRREFPRVQDAEALSGSPERPPAYNVQ